LSQLLETDRTLSIFVVNFPKTMGLEKVMTSGELMNSCHDRNGSDRKLETSKAVTEGRRCMNRISRLAGEEADNEEFYFNLMMLC